jgi:hypothetical protein
MTIELALSVALAAFLGVVFLGQGRQRGYVRR